MTKRTYRGTAQAEVAALTRQRIIEAALALAETRWIDEITLEQIATRAGVTVQTILRHFGSKDGVAAEAARLGNHAVIEHRNAALAGDLDSIVTNLSEHYEQVGDQVYRTLVQNDQYPQLKEFLAEGRSFHRQWVERVFAPWLAALPEGERLMRVLELVATCDVYLWKLLRRDWALGADEYRLTLRDMLTALLNRTH